MSVDLACSAAGAALTLIAFTLFIRARARAIREGWRK